MLYYTILWYNISYYDMTWCTIIWHSWAPDRFGWTFRKGTWYSWKPSSSSKFSIRAFRAYHLVEIRQTVPCRAVRGNGISVNSTLPPSLTCATHATHVAHMLCVCVCVCMTQARTNIAKKHWFHSLPFKQIQALLTLCSKSFSPFPHGTCLLSVSNLCLALDYMRTLARAST